MPMTSRQRLLNTIRHEPTDRVPISLYELSQFAGSAYASFANEEPSYRRLLETMAEKTDCILQVQPSVHYPGIEAVTETIRWSEGDSEYERTILHTPKGDLTALNRRDKNIFTVWCLEHFLKSPEDIALYQSLDLTCRADASPLLDAQARIGEDGLVCPSINDPLCRACELFSMEDFLVYAITEPEQAQMFLDFLWELVREETAQILRADVRDMMFRIVGPEYATPPYLPDRYFADFVTQYVRRLVTTLHDAGAISRVHSHGKVRHALAELAGTGVQCFDPLEPPPDGDLSLAEAKALYGDSMTLLGNMELRDLEQCTPEQIDGKVRDILRDGKPGGRFILMPTATPINIPLAPRTEANLLQFIESGLHYGKY